MEGVWSPSICLRTSVNDHDHSIGILCAVHKKSDTNHLEFSLTTQVKEKIVLTEGAGCTLRASLALFIADLLTTNSDEGSL